MNLEIVDFEINQEPIIVKRIYIRLHELHFNYGAVFEVFFYKNLDETDVKLVKSQFVEINGDDYKKWKDDDNVVFDIICEKLGLVKKEIIINE